MKVLNLCIDDAIRLYNTGESTVKIAEKASVSQKTIVRRMQAAGLQLRPQGQSCAITCAARYGDLTDLVNRYVSGETMKKVSKDSGVNSKQIERAVVAAGHVPRTLLQAVGLRYTNMNLSEKRSLTAKANIAKRGKRAGKFEDPGLIGDTDEDTHLPHDSIG